jgi:hypothetical protein
MGGEPFVAGIFGEFLRFKNDFAGKERFEAAQGS